MMFMSHDISMCDSVQNDGYLFVIFFPWSRKLQSVVIFSY